MKSSKYCIMSVVIHSLLNPLYGHSAMDLNPYAEEISNGASLTSERLLVLFENPKTAIYDVKEHLKRNPYTDVDTFKFLEIACEKLPLYDVPKLLDAQTVSPEKQLSRSYLMVFLISVMESNNFTSIDQRSMFQLLTQKEFPIFEEYFRLFLLSKDNSINIYLLKEYLKKTTNTDENTLDLLKIACEKLSLDHVAKLLDIETVSPQKPLTRSYLLNFLLSAVKTHKLSFSSQRSMFETLTQEEFPTFEKYLRLFLVPSLYFGDEKYLSNENAVNIDLLKKFLKKTADTDQSSLDLLKMACESYLPSYYVAELLDVKIVSPEKPLTRSYLLDFLLSAMVSNRLTHHYHSLVLKSLTEKEYPIFFEKHLKLQAQFSLSQDPTMAIDTVKKYLENTTSNILDFLEMACEQLPLYAGGNLSVNQIGRILRDLHPSQKEDLCDTLFEKFNDGILSGQKMIEIFQYSPDLLPIALEKIEISSFLTVENLKPFFNSTLEKRRELIKETMKVFVNKYSSKPVFLKYVKLLSSAVKTYPNHTEEWILHELQRMKNPSTSVLEYMKGFKSIDGWR